MRLSRRQRFIGLRRQVAARPPDSVRSRTRCPRRRCFPRRCSPPINSTSRLLTTRPMPVPSSALASCPRRLNGWNSCASFSGDNPSPVSCTLMRMRSGVIARARHVDRSAGAVVFDRVGKQIDQNLLHAGFGRHGQSKGCRTAGKLHADAALLRLRFDHGLAIEHALRAATSVPATATACRTRSARDREFR